VAQPLRFRRAPGEWSPGRVRAELTGPLDANLGARAGRPWFSPPAGCDARRFEMDDGSMALFCWTDDDDPPEGAAGDAAGYWLGNTETPGALWQTDKYGFGEVAYPVRRWAERELLAGLHDDEPWLEPYPHVAWFFLTVLCSKDGAATARAFFRDHAAGFPDATRDAGLEFYEAVLHPGTLDDYREVMAGKLGTSQSLDLTRMRAAMAEFDAAKILADAGYEVTPEITVSTGHSLDFRADRPGGTDGDGNGDGGGSRLVEVTRPVPPANRAAESPVAAVRETAATKAGGQLAAHGGGVALFVDLSSFSDDDWAAVREARPDVRHRPAVVFRCRPGGRTGAYRKGSVPLALDPAVEWI